MYEKPAGYQLADKMQKQFRERNAAVSGMQATTTSELMRRAEMGRDPHVNCAEQAFRENYRLKQTARPSRPSSGAVHLRPPVHPAHSPSGQTRSRPDKTERTRPSAAEDVRRHAPRREQPSGRTKQTTAPGPAVPEAPAEIRVRQNPFSPMFLALLLLGTVMVMYLVFSISEVYQTGNEIARLEAELEEQEGEAAELRLRLEEKNDVRRIEEIATAQLGMVKEDALQRRYVSLSDGEYIELCGEEAPEETTGGVMLSSIFSALGTFFERFK